MKYIWPFFLCLLFFSCAHEPNRNKEQVSWQSELGVNLPLDSSWQLTKKRTNHLGNTEMTIVRLEKTREQLIELYVYKTPNAAAAKDLRIEKIAMLNSIYEGRIDPYYVAITKKTVCPAEYLPQTESIAKNGNSLLLISAYANERNTLGACTKDLMQKRAVLAFLTCGSTLIHAEQFIPLHQTTSSKNLYELRSLDCRP